MHCAGTGAPEEGLLFGQTQDGLTKILDIQSAAKANVLNLIGGLPERRKSSLVGYYRTEERTAFQLSAKDLSLAEECFNKNGDIFLIIHADDIGPPNATFFFSNTQQY